MSMNMTEITELERARMRAFRKKNDLGCCLHIVLNDLNIGTDHVQWCIEHARSAKHLECAHIGEILLRASKEQRIELAKAYFGNDWPGDNTAKEAIELSEQLGRKN